LLKIYGLFSSRLRDDGRKKGFPPIVADNQIATAITTSMIDPTPAAAGRPCRTMPVGYCVILYEQCPQRKLAIDFAMYAMYRFTLGWHLSVS
jgi:hypothetical protein